MLAFGLGTLPAFAAGGLLLARARSWLHGRAIRMAAAVLIATFALAGMYRVAVLNDTAHGPFCLAAF
jgi:sulfite exporter TauE/SafE